MPDDTTRYTRHVHAAHDYFTGKPLHDLEQWDIPATGDTPPARFPGLPAGAEYHSGYLAEDRSRRWLYVLRVPPSVEAPSCIACARGAAPRMVLDGRPVPMASARDVSWSAGPSPAEANARAALEKIAAMDGSDPEKGYTDEWTEAAAFTEAQRIAREALGLWPEKTDAEVWIQLRERLQVYRGLIVGASDEAMAELARVHGWTPEEVERLKILAREERPVSR